MKRLLMLFVIITLIFALSACSNDAELSSNGDETPPVEVVSAAAPPIFSHQTGTYSEGFTLTLSAEDGATVRYTLDGSDPTSDSPEFPEAGLFIDNRSDEPNILSSISVTLISRMLESDFIPSKVNKATVIRAAAFSDDGICSETVTATYLVGLDYQNIKIVSLVLNSSDLFDYNTGIYVFGKSYDEWMQTDPDLQNIDAWMVEGNFSQKGREWEREVLVQVFDQSGQLGIEQKMGIRIMGTGSRRYYQKSFRLTAREEYGSKHFEYPIISGLVTDSTGEPLEKYKSFVLRNGGNDNTYTHLRDPYIQSLVTDRSFATQDSEPCIVFINGEYWGLYTITEDYSDNYIQYNYGVDNKNVIMVKNWELEEGQEGEYELFADTINTALSMDLTSEENYSWLWEQFDKQSFIDHMALTVYINNRDSIFQGNNWRIWRARDTNKVNEYADGKWRFMLFDTDLSAGLNINGRFTDNTLDVALSGENEWCMLLAKLMQVDQFRAEFVNTLMDMRNTAFECSSALEQLDTIKAGYAPYMAEQYQRNGPAWIIRQNIVHTHFDTSIKAIVRFINGRYDYVPKMLRKTLELEGYHSLLLSINDPAGGTVQVNTVTPDLSGGVWEGTYFSDFAITLTAEPAPGYSFAGWSGSLEDSNASITLTLTDDTSITANFERAA